MKNIAVLLAALPLMMLVACAPSEKKQDVPPAPKAAGQSSGKECATSAAPASAKDIVTGYANRVVSAPDKARAAQAKVDLGAIQEAVRNFMVENGRYPESLGMIQGYLRPGSDLASFGYDPSTGTVCVK